MALFSLTVNASDVPSSQSNFPAYVDLSRAPAGFWSVVTNGGGDIRCYADSAKTTEYPREVVSCDTGTDTGELHVKITSLTSTTTIYIDVDGIRSEPAFTDTYGRNAVWSGYQAVWHLGDTTDSTVNGYTLTNTGSVTFSAGLFGNAASITSSGQYLKTATTVGLNKADNISFSLWAKLDSETSSEDRDLFAWRDNATTTGGNYRAVYEYNGGTRRMRAYANPRTSFMDKTASLGSTSWYHWVYTYNSSGGSKFYKNNDTSTNDTGTGTLTVGGTEELTIGSSQEYTYTAPWKGLIDEFRVYTGTLSANWITTEYNNQSDEAGFWGTWTDAGGGATFTPRVSFIM